MAINERLKRFLDQQKVEYETWPHREVFTAQEVAAASHVPGRQLAKVVVVRADSGGYLMVVLPAACRVDLPALKTVTGKRKLDACFPHAKDIFFQAGNHQEVVRLTYADYERLVGPTVEEFCLHEREKSISA